MAQYLLHTYYGERGWGGVGGGGRDEEQYLLGKKRAKNMADNFRIH